MSMKNPTKLRYMGATYVRADALDVGELSSKIEETKDYGVGESTIYPPPAAGKKEQDRIAAALDKYPDITKMTNPVVQRMRQELSDMQRLAAESASILTKLSRFIATAEAEDVDMPKNPEESPFRTFAAFPGVIDAVTLGGELPEYLSELGFDINTLASKSKALRELGQKVAVDAQNAITGALKETKEPKDKEETGGPERTLEMPEPAAA